MEKNSSTIKRRRKEQYMNRLRLRAEGGFTLIELLVVIAIIGILAAIAIPQFAAYRRRAFIAQVQTDLRNAAVAEEAFFVGANAYQNGALVSGTPPGYNQTANVTLTAALVGTQAFTIAGTNTSCDANEVWTYSSVTGSITVVDGTPNTSGCL
jgi:type IV pilus assembly protein PilA